MPFGHQAEPSIVYQYGAKAPTGGAEEIAEQMWLAHRYRNTLIEIERDRREQVAAAVRELSPELEELEGRYEALREQIAGCRQRIKAIRQRTRKRTAVPEALKNELAVAREEYRQVAAARKEAKAAAYETPQAQAALAPINDAAQHKAKAARKDSGVYWGTYLQVESAAQQSRREKAPPRFLRWTHEGKVAVQLQGGLSVDDAFAGRDGRFRLDPLPENASDAGVGPRHRRTRAWVRVGSEGRDPVWATLPVTLHRPLPEDARIKWVYVIRRRVACHDKWSLCIVLSRSEGWGKTDLARDGEVGIDVGWRLLEHGLRVAYWVGSDGAHGEVVIPLKDAARWKKVEDLRSIRDQQFDAARDALVEWLAGRTVPDWLMERTAHLRQWRSTARLAAVAIAWRNQRFDGDEQMFSALEAWRKKDKHLYEWEANQRRKATAWRLDYYRRIAADLSRRYRVAKIEDTDWRAFARKPQPEESHGGSTRYWMRVASPGGFLQLVRQRFAETVTMPAEYTTQTCHACGEFAQAETRTGVIVRCRHCGELWDQDYNGAWNLLHGTARAPEAQETP